MDIIAVREEIRVELAKITGLRAVTAAPTQPPVPAALVMMPEKIEYGLSGNRMLSRVTDLEVLVVCGAASTRTAPAVLGAYTAETGAKSVPAIIEAHARQWVACDDVTVGWVDFPDVSIKGVDYLCASFHLQIIGKGAS